MHHFICTTQLPNIGTFLESLYMDDLAISAKSIEDEDQKVHLILQHFRDLGLSLKLSKCEFRKPEIEFLGMVVGSGCIHMDPAKLLAIAAWPSPKTVKAVWSFLGFCNLYCKFIPGFSNTAAPLTALTWKNQPWMWSSEQETAFATLISCFQHAPILHLPDVCCPFIIMTDASLLASGGVLIQKDDNGDLHPCAYLSQMFTPAEQNYDIYDWELLAVIHALDHWHYYLQGTNHLVMLLTDHKNLTYFWQPQKLSCWQAQWMKLLQDFDLHFIHIPGSTMGPTDALSHLVDPDTSSNNTNVTLLPDDLCIHTIDTTLVDKITSSTATDPLVLDALKSLSAGLPLFPHSSLTEWHCSDSCLYFKNHLYIPPDARHDMVASIHSSLTSGHGGFFAPTLCYLVTTGGQVCPLLFAVSSLAVPSVSRWRLIPTQPSLHSHLFPPSAPAHFSNCPSTWLPTSHPPTVMTLCWLWSAMAFWRG